MRPENDARAVRPRSRWLFLCAAALAASSAFATWWTTTLRGLPDIPEPFDVEAFCRPIPDEDNAFTLYKLAGTKLTPEPPDRNGVWATAGPDERRWLETNREALDLWRRGTARPDALYNSPERINIYTLLPAVQSLRQFARLAVLEGSRLEAAGDPDAAMGWYLAMLRSGQHLGRRGMVIERLVGCSINSIAVHRMTMLAKDPATDAKTVRRALDATIEAQLLTPPFSDHLKAEYLMAVHTMKDPTYDDPSQLTSAPPTNRFGRAGGRVSRRFWNEPERSLRVHKLLLANWLTACNLPKSTRPTPITIGMPSPLGTWQASPALSLYPVGPALLSNPQALTPEHLGMWFRSTIDARAMISDFGTITRVIDKDRLGMANLIITLASELCLRDTGAAPSNPNDLVGPYLKALPEDLPPSAPIP